MLPLTIRPPGSAAFQEPRLALVHEWRDVDGLVCALGYVGEGARWMRWPGFTTFRFGEDGAVDAFPEREVESSRILDLFHRTVEPLVLQALGWETLHASAALMPRGLVGFCGECESGKSTIAYSLSRQGYPQKADDSVVVRVGRRDVRAVELPFGVRLRPASATFFGFSPDERPLQDVVPIATHHADRVSTHPLAALFVLARIPFGEPVVEPLSSPAAFRALLPHARCFDAESAADRRRLFEHYLEIAATVPVYELRFPSGLEQLPSVLACIERLTDAVFADHV